MDALDTIMANWSRHLDANPDIREAIKEGYEVAAYDEETGMIICVEKVESSLKVRIIEDGYIIRKKESAA